VRLTREANQADIDPGNVSILLEPASEAAAHPVFALVRAALN
jgi:hypothetical protein